MAATASALAQQLEDRGVPLFRTARGITGSHQFAIRAERYGGGHNAAKRLRAANILTSGIGLPIAPVAGDFNGLRVGTPEIVRWGMTVDDMPDLAGLFVDALTSEDASAVAGRVAAFRERFRTLHFVRS
jgi:glycine hydroxymethyltransferase